MAGFRHVGRIVRVLPFGWLALAPLSAHAQANASDKAAAEALFDQGLRLMKQNNFNEACPKLEESDRIDPAVGTLLYLGECYEKVGRTASAWATFREAASLATTSNQADRARVAAARAQDLESKLSRLTIEVAPDVAKIPGLVVKRGSQRLEASLLGTPLPIDPGEYKVEVTAPGYEPWSTPIKVDAGGATASVRVPALVKSSEPAGASAAPPASPELDRTAGTSTAPAPVALSSRDAGLSGQQTLGLVLGGVGVIGVGLGSYFGVRAITKNSDAEEHCPDPGLCKNETGLSLTDEAKDQAQLSNIAFAAGGALVAVGAVLFLTGRPSDRDRVTLVPLLSPRAAGANVVGRF